MSVLDTASVCKLNSTYNSVAFDIPRGDRAGPLSELRLEYVYGTAASPGPGQTAFFL